MKNILLFALSLLFTCSVQAQEACIGYSDAKLIAQNTIQAFIDLDTKYKQDNPTVNQIVSLMNNFQFNGRSYTSKLPFAGGNLTWELAVYCNGKSYFDAEYTGSYDDGYNFGD